jgi:hypothetical protein
MSNPLSPYGDVPTPSINCGAALSSKQRRAGSFHTIFGDQIPGDQNAPSPKVAFHALCLQALQAGLMV